MSMVYANRLTVYTLFHLILPFHTTYFSTNVPSSGVFMHVKLLYCSVQRMR
ncbi:hypothetical protein B7P43_G13787 [Cryptotermes secundus]|uniref:Uncharacterized protein n=1 Tax=Cryptotermes secundus TaxID=105785 RepID=A0A2J7RKU8_9NEOP|nr:hypothetical protein B7P43_G13787 [Cryptotermes secundus]